MMVKLSWKEDRNHIIFIVALAILFLMPYFKGGFSYAFYESDLGNVVASGHEVIKNSIVEHGQFPLWNVFNIGGTPLFASPQVGVLSLTTLLTLLFPTVYGGMKIAFLIFFITSGLGMFVLMRYLRTDRSTAIVAAAVYLLNGTTAFFFYGYTFMAQVYALLPWIVLSTTAAVRSKHWLVLSLTSGALFAVAFLGGSISHFLYSWLFVFILLLYNFVLNYKRKFVLVKIGLVGLLIILSFVTLSAVKLLPAKDFVDMTQRDTEHDYEFMLGGGHYLKGDDFVRRLFDAGDPLPLSHDGTGQIGYFTAFLVLLSIPFFKKKNVLFYQIMIILVILFMMKGPVSHFVWKYVPLMSQQKNLDKALFLFNFCAAVLAGFGFMSLRKFAKEKLNSSMIKWASVAVIGIVALEMGMLGWLGYNLAPGEGSEYDYKFSVSKVGDVIDDRAFAMMDMNSIFSDQPVLEHISRDEDAFRIHIAETRGIWDQGTSHITTPFGVEQVFGGANVWHRDFPMFYQIAMQTGQTPRLFGIFGAKYFISSNPIDHPQLTLAKEFDTSGVEVLGTSWPSRFTYGKFLYQNTEYVPKYYVAKHAVIVIGDDDLKQQISYGLLLHPDYDPSDMILVDGGYHVSAFTQEELGRFDAILLAQRQLGPEDRNILSNYVSEGKMLIPDVVNGESALTPDHFNSLIGSLSDNTTTFDNVPLLKKSPNHLIFDTEGKVGFLMLAEKFSMFPGWKSEGNDILRAQGVMSAIVLDGSENVELEYSPSSFKKGAYISSLALIFFIIYLIFFFKGRRGRDGKV